MAERNIRHFHGTKASCRCLFFFLRSGELFDFENYKVCPQQDFHPIRPGGLLLSSVVEMIRQKKSPMERRQIRENELL